MQMDSGRKESPSVQEPSEKLLHFNSNQEIAYYIPIKIPLPGIRHLILIHVFTFRSESLHNYFKEQFGRI